MQNFDYERLILGYLYDRNYENSAECILRESSSLNDFRKLRRKGKKLQLKLLGLNLVDILQDYFNCKDSISDLIEKFPGTFNCVPKVSSLASQLEAICTVGLKTQQQVRQVSELFFKANDGINNLSTSKLSPYGTSHRKIVADKYGELTPPLLPSHEPPECLHSEALPSSEESSLLNTSVAAMSDLDAGIRLSAVNERFQVSSVDRGIQVSSVDHDFHVLVDHRLQESSCDHEENRNRRTPSKRKGLVHRKSIIGDNLKASPSKDEERVQLFFKNLINNPKLPTSHCQRIADYINQKIYKDGNQDTFIDNNSEAVAQKISVTSSGAKNITDKVNNLSSELARDPMFFDLVGQETSDATMKGFYNLDNDRLLNTPLPLTSPHGFNLNNQISFSNESTNFLETTTLHDSNNAEIDSHLNRLDYNYGNVTVQNNVNDQQELTTNIIASPVQLNDAMFNPSNEEIIQSDAAQPMPSNRKRKRSSPCSKSTKRKKSIFDITDGSFSGSNSTIDEEMTVLEDNDHESLDILKTHLPQQNPTRNFRPERELIEKDVLPPQANTIAESSTTTEGTSILPLQLPSNDQNLHIETTQNQDHTSTVLSHFKESDNSAESFNKSLSLLDNNNVSYLNNNANLSVKYYAHNNINVGVVTPPKKTSLILGSGMENPSPNEDDLECVPDNVQKSCTSNTASGSESHTSSHCNTAPLSSESVLDITPENVSHSSACNIINEANNDMSPVVDTILDYSHSQNVQNLSSGNLSTITSATGTNDTGDNSASETAITSVDVIKNNNIPVSGHISHPPSPQIAKIKPLYVAYPSPYSPMKQLQTNVRPVNSPSVINSKYPSGTPDYASNYSLTELAPLDGHDELQQYSSIQTAEQENVALDLRTVVAVETEQPSVGNAKKEINSKIKEDPIGEPTIKKKRGRPRKPKDPNDEPATSKKKSHPRKSKVPIEKPTTSKQTNLSRTHKKTINPKKSKREVSAANLKNKAIPVTTSKKRSGLDNDDEMSEGIKLALNAFRITPVVPSYSFLRAQTVTSKPSSSSQAKNQQKENDIVTFTEGDIDSLIDQMDVNSGSKAEQPLEKIDKIQRSSSNPPQSTDSPILENNSEALSNLLSHCSNEEILYNQSLVLRRKRSSSVHISPKVSQMHSRVCKSTPRHKSHVRVLDFGTPDKNKRLEVNPIRAKADLDFSSELKNPINKIKARNNPQFYKPNLSKISETSCEYRNVDNITSTVDIENVCSDLFLSDDEATSADLLGTVVPHSAIKTLGAMTNYILLDETVGIGCIDTPGKNLECTNLTLPIISCPTPVPNKHRSDQLFHIETDTELPEVGIPDTPNVKIPSIRKYPSGPYSGSSEGTHYQPSKYSPVQDNMVDMLIKVAEGSKGTLISNTRLNIPQQRCSGKIAKSRSKPKGTPDDNLERSLIFEQVEIGVKCTPKNMSRRKRAAKQLKETKTVKKKASSKEQAMEDDNSKRKRTRRKSENKNSEKTSSKEKAVEDDNSKRKRRRKSENKNSEKTSSKEQAMDDDDNSKRKRTMSKSENKNSEKTASSKQAMTDNPLKRKRSRRKSETNNSEKTDSHNKQEMTSSASKSSRTKSHKGITEKERLDIAPRETSPTLYLESSSDNSLSSESFKMVERQVALLDGKNFSDVNPAKTIANVKSSLKSNTSRVLRSRSNHACLKSPDRLEKSTTISDDSMSSDVLSEAGNSLLEFKSMPNTPTKELQNICQSVVANGAMVAIPTPSKNDTIENCSTDSDDEYSFSLSMSHYIQLFSMNL